MTEPTKKCTNCQGKGTIEYRDYKPDPPPLGRRIGSADTVTSNKTCYRCKGTGLEEKGQ